MSERRRSNRPTRPLALTQAQLCLLAQELAMSLDRRLPPGIRFLLALTDDTGEAPGVLAYSANMSRESATEVMMELCEAFALEMHAAGSKS